jgi:hypothetical protein
MVLCCITSFVILYLFFLYSFFILSLFVSLFLSLFLFSLGIFFLTLQPYFLSHIVAPRESYRVK